MVRITRLVTPVLTLPSRPWLAQSAPVAHVPSSCIFRWSLSHVTLWAPWKTSPTTPRGKRRSGLRVLRLLTPLPRPLWEPSVSVLLRTPILSPPALPGAGAHSLTPLRRLELCSIGRRNHRLSSPVLVPTT